ncbi:uncharacterized protein KY384_009135 [Bacidia gigantensis]|uniref:uncharacterized protein n=1 Tax=Bacidia gigantensis TaxID=2732470 RepID=UPI001D05677A|nr:uncharacterized protein KY384_009135 [Bacidia gigantensis]KAG8525491.1 hypothetical protein KY384_009135 [Bacidia gigantensis]
MSRINIPLEALTSRLNLGSRFEGVRSQSLGTRFSNLKPIGDFMDLKRLSKPANFGEVQSRVNYNLGYFQSNYFALATMLAIYSLLTNLRLLFDMIFMGVGLFFIRRLDGQDLQLGFTTLTTSQLYTGLFVIGIPVFIWASPIATALWLVGAIGVTVLGHAAFMDKPIEPSGARTGKKGRGYREPQDDDVRFQEVESDSEDSDAGVGLDRKFKSDELHFTGADLGGVSKRRRKIAYDSDSGTSSDSNDDIENAIEGRNMQVALRDKDFRDKEDMLVEKALQRIQRAQELGKKNVKLSQREIEALQRRDQKVGKQTAAKQSSKSAKKPVKNEKSRDRKQSLPLHQYDDRQPSNSRMPPGILVPSGNGYYTHTAIGYDQPTPLPVQVSSRSGSRNTSSHNLSRASPENLRRGERQSPKPQSPRSPPSNASSRSLPDDPNWEPRPRSASALSGSQYYPTTQPYMYQTYSPPLPQIPSSPGTSSRRIVSNPSPSSRDRLPRYEGLDARSKRERSPQTRPGRNMDVSSSDDDGDEGVQVDILPGYDGRGYDAVRPVGESGARDRRGGRR